MGKREKEHRKRSRSRTEKIQGQKKKYEKYISDKISKQIKLEKEQGLFDNAKTLGVSGQNDAAEIKQEQNLILNVDDVSPNPIGSSQDIKINE
jgi:hypothetical protein